MSDNDVELTDSMTLLDLIASGDLGGRTPLSRKHPHTGKYYLAVHVPTKVFDAAVSSVTADVGGTEVGYNNETGTYTDALSGMTVKVFTSGGDYKGKVRMRGLTDPAGTSKLTVAEQDHLGWTIGDLFEIYDVMELWVKFPRQTEEAEQNLDAAAATNESEQNLDAADVVNIIDGQEQVHYTFFKQYDNVSYTNKYLPLDDFHVIQAPHELYIGYTKEFLGVVWAFGDTTNIIESGLDCKYWDGTTWSASANFVDGTIGIHGGKWCTLNQNGTMSWDRPGDWEQCAVDDVTLYWVQMHITGANSSLDMDLIGLDVNGDKDSGDVSIPCTGHGYDPGDEITIDGTVNYDGDYTVLATSAANFIDITAHYIAETFAGDGAETVWLTVGVVGIPLTGHGYAADVEIRLSGTVNYNGTYTVLGSSGVDVIHITAEYEAEVFTGSETAQNTLITFYRDYDVTPATAKYPMRNTTTPCVPIMGPPTCAFLESGTATIYFSGEHTYNVHHRRLVPSFTWAFQSGTPNSSAVMTPGNVTWDTAGTYRVSLYADLAPTYDIYPLTGYRYVHIFERTGANAPYTEFNVKGLRGDFSSGGWEAEFEVFTDASEDEFPEGAQIILFAEEEVGSYTFGSDMPSAYRAEVKYVGYIVGGSISKDSESSAVTFRTAGIQKMMMNRDSFSLALDYTASAAQLWELQQELSANFAFMNLIPWNSTLMNITDVLLPSYHYENWVDVSHRAADYLIKYQDFDRGTLWDQISGLAADAFAQVVASNHGTVSIANDPQFTDPDDLQYDLPEATILTSADWMAPFVIDFLDEPNVSVVCIEGVSFDGTTVTPIIAYYPSGSLPTYRGKIETKSGCILSDQSGADFFATCLFAVRNNKYPRVLLNCLGNYSMLDLTSYGGIQMTLEAGDTRRGIVWTDKRLFITGVEHEIDMANGVLTTTLHLVHFAADDARILFA